MRRWGLAPHGSGRNSIAATYTRVSGLLDAIKRMLAGAKADAEAVAEREEPVARPQGDDERETSTNAQVSGASDEPWPGRD